MTPVKESKDSTSDGTKDSMQDKDSYMQDKDSSMQGKDSSMQGKDSSMQGKESSMQGKDSSMQGKDSSMQDKDSSMQGKESSMQGKDSSMQGKDSFEGLVNPMPKRKLSSPSWDTELVTETKKRRHSADHIVSLLGRETTWVGKKGLQIKFATMPQRAKKSQASPAWVRESWRGFGNKKIKLSDDSTAFRDNRTASLRGADPAAQRKVLDGQRNQRARKRQASPASVRESWLRSDKKRKTLSDATNASTNTRTPSLRGPDPAAEEHIPHDHRNNAYKRSCSSSSSWNESLRRNVNFQLTTDTSQEEDDQGSMSYKQKIVAEFRRMGVRVFTKHEVNLMTDTMCEFLGEGVFGYCVKTVDLDTHQLLVIKGFFGDYLDGLLEETTNLFQLQMEGVQRLVGVCVDNCEMISHFAGVTLEQYLEKPIPLADAADIFLQLTRTCKRIRERRFVHNDLHPGNICVSNGGSGPLATIIDFGFAGPVEGESDGMKSVVRMIKLLEWSARVGFQHPLVAAVFSLMEPPTSSHPDADPPTLSTLEEVLETFLEQVAKATPPSTSVGGEETLLKRHESSETDECSH